MQQIHTVENVDPVAVYGLQFDKLIFTHDLSKDLLALVVQVIYTNSCEGNYSLQLKLTISKFVNTCRIL